MSRASNGMNKMRGRPALACQRKGDTEGGAGALPAVRIGRGAMGKQARGRLQET